MLQPQEGYFSSLVCVIIIIAHYYWAFSLFVVGGVTARRPLNSIQLACGDWDVALRVSSRFDMECLFPSTYQRPLFPVLGKTTPLRETTPNNDAMQSAFVKQRKWGTTTIHCILSVSSDGTFVLAPKRITSLPSHGGGEKEEENPTMYLRGCWNVAKNPYCLTDRTYDQLSLTSYARQRIIVPSGRARNGSSRGSSSTTEDTEHVLQTIRIKMNSRLWGRHGRNTSRKRKEDNNNNNNNRKKKEHRSTPSCVVAGEMTHGTLVRFEYNVPWWKHYFHRPVLGSFSARRTCEEPKYEGWIDKDYFGY